MVRPGVIPWLPTEKAERERRMFIYRDRLSVPGDRDMTPAGALLRRFRPWSMVVVALAVLTGLPKYLVIEYYY